MNATRWLDCAPSAAHGNIIQRVLFCKRGVESADGTLAVLRHVDRFAHATLAPGVESLPHADATMEKVFFVAAGSAVLVADGAERRVSEGDGVLMPPGVRHVFRNDGDVPLELLVTEETVPNGSTGERSAPVVRNYRDCAVGRAHWHHDTRRLFGPEDGMRSRGVVLVVSMEPMTVSEPHGHGEDIDEVWYMWKGSGIHMVGREVCHQTAGTAIQVAPCDPGHALINHTDAPLYAFYFSRFA